jgi:hypothetical protein
MLYRDNDFEEWQLAEKARAYIPLYLKRKDDRVCYVDYKDVPTGTIKQIKFVYEEATGWMYVDNSQHS